MRAARPQTPRKGTIPLTLTWRRFGYKPRNGKIESRTTHWVRNAGYKIKQAFSFRNKHIQAREHF